MLEDTPDQDYAKAYAQAPAKNYNLNPTGINQYTLNPHYTIEKKREGVIAMLI